MAIKTEKDNLLKINFLLIANGDCIFSAFVVSPLHRRRRQSQLSIWRQRLFAFVFGLNEKSFYGFVNQLRQLGKTVFFITDKQKVSNFSFKNSWNFALTKIVRESDI